MNKTTLDSNAEKLAERAEELPAFSGLKLSHVKKQVASILGQIGHDGIFDEYTKHDISHIDFMLKSLDMIIPQETQKTLTSAEWLMLTLSIYFHDLGMLVTKSEFEDRNSSTFLKFKQEIQDGAFGFDYKDKIFSLASDRQDRFIYQELVRRTHAARIKFWILNEHTDYFPNTSVIATEIKELTNKLDDMFVRDLALICESHHLSDLENFDKYKPNQQYGQSDQEVVNLHYCALILRTADLLHITSDRTPSIEFKLISPTDPISQEEWAKQRSVKAVRPQTKTNREGVLDDSLTKDTFEIIALFNDEEGFFGLISYINYANRQLKENFKYNELSNRQFGKNYGYPWRNIDDTKLETKDFEKKQFVFQLDQQKILDLLVGHTLYNDPSVVLRELTQNAIDASKLRRFEYVKENQASKFSPKIKITWDPHKRELSFTDNGTGMTLEIIQNHLLKVGSSRYQDENFKKKYPEFSPISRFGIGLLTCFLIADDLDITTKYCDAEKAIQLKIRKVHGKYLLKHLANTQVDEQIRNHGTEIKLYVRSEINLNRLEEELKKWILFPDCDIELIIGEETKKIGYSSPKQFLEKQLELAGYNLSGSQFKVVEEQMDGVTIAYALKYIEHWKEWGFVDYRQRDEGKYGQPVGNCIEGIRVGFDTPGFHGKNIYAIANSSGKTAPKTNVARSNIEVTPEREHLLSTIYKLYLSHLNRELARLKTDNSLSWAVKEANYLLQNFSQGNRYNHNGSVVLEDYDLFKTALSDLDFVLIENETTRSLISVNKLIGENHFWTIECVSYKSADSLVKEVKSSTTSAIQVLKAVYGGGDAKTSHLDRVLCNDRFDSEVSKLIRQKFQVSEIKTIPEQRRIDLKWTLTTNNLWEEITIHNGDGMRIHSNICYLQMQELEIVSNLGYSAIFSNDYLFLLTSPVTVFLIKIFNSLKDKPMAEKELLEILVSIVEACYSISKHDEKIINDIIEQKNVRNAHRFVWQLVEKEEFIQALLETNFRKFDTSIWNRRDIYY